MQPTAAPTQIQALGCTDEGSFRAVLGAQLPVRVPDTRFPPRHPSCRSLLRARCTQISVSQCKDPRTLRLTWFNQSPGIGTLGDIYLSSQHRQCQQHFSRTRTTFGR